MRRGWLVALGIGVVALVAAIALGGTGSVDLPRSGLAAWLVVIALPLGALPVLMALDLAGLGEIQGSAALRLLLAIFPLAAIVGAVGFGIAAFQPSHHELAGLYAWSGGATQGFAARWFDPTWFACRGVLYLVIWLGLAVVFLTPAARPSAGRRQVAAWGLALHLVVGTLAAIDWTLSLDLGPSASAFGLLLITLQCAFALTVTSLVIAVAHDRASSRVLNLMTLAAVAAAAFMQFVQYLVVWSANLPREILWYQHRLGGLGSALFVAAPVVLIAAAAVLMPPGPSTRAWPVRGATALLAALEIADLLWLVTPAWRGSFTVSALDILALIGVAGVFCAGGALITRRTVEARHG